MPQPFSFPRRPRRPHARITSLTAARICEMLEQGQRPWQILRALNLELNQANIYHVYRRVRGEPFSQYKLRAQFNPRASRSNEWHGTVAELHKTLNKEGRQ